MPRLAGKLALITGGNSGIGLATAKAFIAEGARVAITGRNPETLEEARKELLGRAAHQAYGSSDGSTPLTVNGGGETLAVRSDVSNLKDLDQLYATIDKHFGGLDILFANAGIGKSTPLGNTTEEVFDEIFDINVKGVFFTVQKALPLLKRGASIILNASIGPRLGRPGAAAYAASKAAVRTMARNFSADLMPRGIRVNAVSPGLIASPIWTRSKFGPEGDDPVDQKLRSSIPLGRLGTPDEVAQVVVFLASNESSFILGSEIIIDGGAIELPAGAPVYRSNRHYSDND